MDRCKYLFTIALLCVSNTVFGQEAVTPEEQIAETQINSTNSVTTEGVPAVVPLSTTSRRPPFQGVRLPCACGEGQCGCCTGAILDRFRQKVCANFTYEPDDFALTSSMTMNGKVVYKNTVSGKNPPPMCASIPRLPFVRLCMRFYNIYFASRNMHVCLDMEANWDEITLVEWSFDCVRMGASGFAVVPPEEGGGLPPSPIDAEEQTDEDYDDSARNAPKVADNRNEVVFDSSFSKLATRKPNRTLFNVRKTNGGYVILSRRGSNNENS